MLDGSAQDDRAQDDPWQDDRVWALRLIKAVQQCVTSDGSLRLTDKDGKVNFIPLGGIDDFIEKNAPALKGTTIAPFVYEHQKGDEEPNRVGTAIVWFRIEAPRISVEIPCDDGDDPLVGEAKNAAIKSVQADLDAALDHFYNHIDKLRDFGSLANVSYKGASENGTRTIEATPRMWFAFFLKEPIPCDEAAKDDPDVMRAAYKFTAIKSEGNGFNKVLPFCATLSLMPDISLDEIISGLECFDDPFDGPEDQGLWLTRDASYLINMAQRWVKSGRNWNIFERLGPPKERKGSEETIEFLVPGLVPKGRITEMVGKAGSGKSTLAHELAIKAGTPGTGEISQTWLGRPVVPVPNDKIVVFLAGEDDDAMLNDRGRYLDPEGKAENLCTLSSDGRDLSEILLEIEGTPTELLIVDPARKYLGGLNEQDSAPIDKFFSLLEDFAKRNNCAVLVIHHLSKKAHTRTSREMVIGIRGSGVFGDRPRVIICVHRLANHTRIGIGKHNLPPSCAMMEGDQLFVRDASTLQHLPMKEASNPRGPAEHTSGQGVNEADLVVVLGALKRLNDEGKSAVRFGKKSVYGRGAPEVQGMARKAVERAVDALIASDQVVVTENDGITVTVPKKPES